MSLMFTKPGEMNHIKRVMGDDRTRKYLVDMGFVEGAPITVLSRVSGNLIVEIMGTRVAIDRSMANRIIVGRGSL
jgi:ferrous iron transport protein A